MLIIYTIKMCFPRGQEALFIVTYNNIFPRANSCVLSETISMTAC